MHVKFAYLRALLLRAVETGKCEWVVLATASGGVFATRNQHAG